MALGDPQRGEAVHRSGLPVQGRGEAHQDLSCGRRPLARGLLEALHHQGHDGWGERRLKLIQRWRRLLDVAHQHQRRARIVERRTSSQHPVQDDAQGVEVGPRGDRVDLALGLLGCNDQRGPHQDAPLGEGDALFLPFQQLREAEVQNLEDQRITLDDEDILRLQIAVDDVHFMCGRERATDLFQVWKDVGREHAALPLEDGVHHLQQLTPLQHLHHVVYPALPGPAQIVDVDDVGVVDADGDPGFIDEPISALGIVHLVQDLDGDLPLDLRVRRQVHGPHPPLAQQAKDNVVTDPHAGAGSLRCSLAGAGIASRSIRRQGHHLDRGGAGDRHLLPVFIPRLFVPVRLPLPGSPRDRLVRPLSPARH